MNSKSNFRNLILKNYEEYLIYGTYFNLAKDFKFKLNRKVKFFERSDKMA